ncbi:hypothetical protein [Desulfofundulus thermocisternus]|uniref:hypothetical protein n=1 Tax=Desulfofundulus thermocisternus TaxID=42471 RepID=UPI00217DE1B4|nr:hypothetical protein [Desulfofundulus thermocisternus]MCS5696932.1 hypothetical protein [Desulfofundulus thermocisternus]
MWIVFIGAKHIAKKVFRFLKGGQGKMDQNALLILRTSNLIAVMMYLIWYGLRVIIYRHIEHYPPWTGVKPWLRAAYTGACCGIAFWMAECYSKFLSHSLQTMMASAGIIVHLGFWVAIALQVVLFYSVTDSIRRIYSWIAYNVTDTKKWRLLIPRVLTCTGLMGVVGMIFFDLLEMTAGWLS